MGWVHPRLGSGRVGSGPDFLLTQRVGSDRVGHFGL